jgi:hypothetical protein
MVPAIQGGRRGIMIEEQHYVMRLLKWLPAGPAKEGGHRAKDLVQFVARDGGIRTIAVDDLTLL